MYPSTAPEPPHAPVGRPGRFRACLLAVTVLVGLTGARGSEAVAAAATAGPLVSLTVAGGPANTALSVSGQGFAAAEPVDIYVGTTPVGHGTAGTTGALPATAVTIPATTQPGYIPVLAAGRTSHLTGSARFAVKSDWAQPGFGPTNQGSNPFENTISKFNAAGLKLAWRVNVQDPIPQAFVVSNGFVLWATDQGLTGISESTGRSWINTELTGGGTPIAGGGLVFMLSAATGSNMLVAVDVYTGRQRWSRPVDSIASTFVSVAGGFVYLKRPNGLMYELLGATGAQVLTFDPGCPSNDAVIGPDIIYFQCPDQSVRAIDVSSGALRWKKAYDGPGFDRSLGLSLQGTTLLVSHNALLTAANAATGAVRWTVKSGLGPNTGTTVFDQSAGGIRAIDLATGAVRWTSQVAGGLAVANGVLYVSDSSSVTVADAQTGAVLGVPIHASDRAYGVDTAKISSGAVYLTIIDRDGNGKYYGSELVKYTPPPLPRSFTTFDDRAPASGADHLTFSAGWKQGVNAADYLGGDSYTSVKGATATFGFTGTGFRLWFSAASHHGIATVTADRKTATGSVRTTFTIDEYSAIRHDGVSSVTSPQLPLGSYTVTVTASGTKNAASTGSTISLDRIDLGR